MDSGIYILIFYGALFLFALVIPFVMFFYQAFNTAKLARMAGYKSPGLSYLPVVNVWVRASVGHESKKRATTAIVLKAASLILSFGALIVMIVGILVVFSSAINDPEFSDAAFNSFMIWIFVSIGMLVVSGIMSLVGRSIVGARIDMAFVEAFEVEAGVAALTVNNFRGGWAYANLLSRIASQMEKGLKYKFDAPAF